MVIALAAKNPYKFAPIIAHSVFASLNILLNRITPENRKKILEIIFGCSDAIRDCISFERNCSVKLEDDIKAIQRDLPDLYIKALKLIYEVQRSCGNVQREDKSRIANVGEEFKKRGIALWTALSDKMVDWESKYADIKTRIGKVTNMKKRMEDSIKNLEHTVKVRNWIKTKDDPEPPLIDIKEKVMPDGNYEDAASWLLECSDFTRWREAYQHNTQTKRVLWIRGGYGTGKTTLLYHVYVEMTENPKYWLPEIDDKQLIVARYFCSATSGGQNSSTHETVIRGLLRRLALLPDCSLIEPIEALYSKATLPQARGQQAGERIAETEVGQEVSLRRWEEVFNKVIEETSKQCHYVFLVDALDECMDTSEIEKLLEFMRSVFDKHPMFLFYALRMFKLKWKIILIPRFSYHWMSRK